MGKKISAETGKWFDPERFKRLWVRFDGKERLRRCQEAARPYVARFLKWLDDDRVVWKFTAACIVSLMALFAWPALPHLWDEMAVAAQLRPPESAFPGIWRGVLALLYLIFPAGLVEVVLKMMGMAAGTVLSLLVYSILEMALPDVLRVKMRGVGRGRIVVRLILSIGTVFFMCNEAVWGACQGFGSLTFHLLLAISALWLVLRFFHFDGFPKLYLAMLAWGLLAGDGPVGWAFAAMTVVATYLKALSNPDDQVNPIGNPLVRRVVLGKMISIFLGTVVAGLVFNYQLYGALGGVRASAELPTNVVVICLGGYWTSFATALSGTGWFLFCMTVVAPFLVALIPLRRALIEDRFVDLSLVFAYTAVGFVSWSQIAGFRCLWFRDWFPFTAVKDGFALAVMCLIGVVTLMWTICVFCKNYHFLSVRHVALAQFQDDAETPQGQEAVWELMRQSRYVRFATRALPFILLLSVVPMRGQWTMRRMLDIVDDYIDEVVRESGDAKWLFTDGAMDAGMELRAAAAGHRLLALSVFSGGSKYEIAVRQREVEGEEDLHALESGAADAMRYWSNDLPDRLPKIAVQVGIERWQRMQKLKPRVSGVLARFGEGPGESFEKDGTAAARALGERIIAAYENANPDGIGDRNVKRLFRHAQWRISYFCRVRADSSAGKEWGEEQRLDDDMMERLDTLNARLAELSKSAGWLSEHHGASLLPREGLRLALERADFKMAKTFAETVLRSAPQDVHANFAIGMYCLMNEQFAKAEAYLLKVLEVRPDDPAVLNNLSVAARKMRHAADAVAYAERAAKAAPDSSEIMRTLYKAKQSFAIISEEEMKKKQDLEKKGIDKDEKGGKGTSGEGR